MCRQEKPAQDVKPKGKATPPTKQKFKPNLMRIETDNQLNKLLGTVEVKANPTAKLDLGRFSRGPGKGGQEEW